MRYDDFKELLSFCDKKIEEAQEAIDYWDTYNASASGTKEIFRSIANSLAKELALLDDRSSEEALRKLSIKFLVDSEDKHKSHLYFVDKESCCPSGDRDKRIRLQAMADAYKEFANKLARMMI